MYQSISKQKGASIVSMLVMLFALGFTLSLFMKLLPVYSEDMAIGSALDSVAHEPEMVIQPLSVYQKKLDNRFSVESISVISPRDISLKQEGANTYFYVEYEKRIPGYFNMDFIFKFKHQVQVITQQK